MKQYFKYLPCVITIITACAFFTTPSFAGCDNLTQKVFSNDGAAGDGFGNPVDLTDKYAIVGATFDDDNGDASGAAYIFERIGKFWFQAAKLTTGDTTTGEKFGYSVAMTNTYAIIGAPFDNANGKHSGSAFIFQRSGHDWVQMAKLTPKDADTYDLFGAKVSITDRYALISAPHNNEQADNDPAVKKKLASAYVFKRRGNAWVQSVKLTSEEENYYDAFASDIALTDNYAAVGANQSPGNGTMKGAVYLFKRNEKGDDDWSLSVKLTPDIISENGHFGAPLDITDQHLLVGTRPWPQAPGTGAPFVFKRTGDSWDQQGRLAINGDSKSYGYSAALTDQYAVVGAKLNSEYGPGFGAAYIFKHYSDSDTWTEAIKLAPLDGVEQENFGASVAAAGQYIAVGAVGAQGNEDGSGAAYFFETNFLK